MQADKSESLTSMKLCTMSLHTKEAKKKNGDVEHTNTGGDTTIRTSLTPA